MFFSMGLRSWASITEGCARRSASVEGSQNKSGEGLSALKVRAERLLLCGSNLQ
jgi:hypothetical protein